MNINIPLLLIALILITGLIIFCDYFFWRKKRKESIATTESEEKVPWLIEQSRTLFPLLILVFLLRSFLGQGFLVPSNSLEPTVLPGDVLLVNQFVYGLKLPIWQIPITQPKSPRRGDIVVLQWPVNPKFNFVKRVIGLPGDTISYIDKVLYINGQAMTQTVIDNETVKRGTEEIHYKRLEENLDGIKHQIYIRPEQASINFYNLRVPEKMYFMMGDNRDDSDDSRFWGFVSERELIGKAFVVALSFDRNHYGLRWNRFWHKV